jgi:hypothetical protein
MNAQLRVIRTATCLDAVYRTQYYCDRTVLERQYRDDRLGRRARPRRAGLTQPAAPGRTGRPEIDRYLLSSRWRPGRAWRWLWWLSGAPAITGATSRL